MKVNLVMTDEFVEFSEKIKALHQERKTKKEEFKKIYAEFQTEDKRLAEEAEILTQEFDTWAESQEEKEDE